ncbi:MAG: hypothetical protein HW416_2500 [Chloroflexi bacterium]|nr:hypothetical protein [Chloroflexota bacterium]
MIWVNMRARIGLLAVLLLSFSFALDADLPRVVAQQDEPTAGVVNDEQVVQPSEPVAAVNQADGDDPLLQPIPGLRCSVSSVGFLYGMVCEEAAPIVLFDLPEIFR